MPNRKMFIAPIDIKSNDVIVLLFGKPIAVKRDGIVIWVNKKYPKTVLELILKNA